MKTATRYSVRVVTGHHGTPGDLPGLLDMLRYESARITNWTHVTSDDGRQVYIVSVLSDFFTPDRWVSFGIRPEVK